MFTKNEIKRNLIGGLEVALFMPTARKWFGDSLEEAVRSFAIPIMLLPLTMVMIYLQPDFQALKSTLNSFALIYCLRIAVSTCLFLACVYWILKQIGRAQHFRQFVIAINWLTIPGAIVFLPILIVLVTGTYSWTEILPLTLCALIYNYAFTGFMATCILRLPWEMGGFIAFVGFMVDNSIDSVMQAINSSL